MKKRHGSARKPPKNYQKKQVFPKEYELTLPTYAIYVIQDNVFNFRHMS